jgi:CDGSH-type Zn-finger protein
MDSKRNTAGPRIVPTPNGPYLLSDAESHSVENLQNSRGDAYSRVSQTALCRCGGSQTKPFCDGTHMTNNFSSKKEPDRQPDKRDNYVGKTITIHDNRGICAHSGICSDGLPLVFRLKREPWIDPDAADAKAVMDIIMKCPSGALSYSIDGVEYRPAERKPMVTVIPDGPYSVTGGVELTGEPRGDGASEEHFTLCRCGGSKNKPFCNGRHWEIDFKAEG